MQLHIVDKFKKLGFSINHLALVGAFFLLLGGLTYSQEPLLLENLFSLKFLKAETQTQDQVDISPVSLGAVSKDGADNIISEKNKLSSLIDPGFSEGSVLGLSTDAQDNINDLLSEKNLQSIAVKEVTNSKDNVSIYVDQIKLVEDYYGSVLVLSVLGTKDQAAAVQAIPLAQNIIAELKSMNVPMSLVRFHRLKMMHYGVVLNMLENIAYQQNVQDRAAAGVLFFEITNAMESAKADLVNQGYFN